MCAHSGSGAGLTQSGGQSSRQPAAMLALGLSEAAGWFVALLLGLLHFMLVELIVACHLDTSA